MNAKISRHNLTSSYLSLPIQVFIKKGDLNSKTAFILHPGAFEKAFGDNNRYKHILLWIQKNMNEKPHIIWYQTARKPDPKKVPESKMDYWEEIFEGKIFKQELGDVEKVYKFILNSTKVFPKKINNIYSLGFSLGGTIAMIMSAQYPQVTKLCALGSAISTKRDNLPILKGYPSKNWIIDRLKRYSQDYLIMQGSEEEIVPVEDAQIIINTMVNARFSTFTRIKGANHMFSGENKYGIIGREKLLLRIRDFFENNYI